MGRRTLLFLTLLTISFGPLSRAQNILSEGFEGASFPPVGWSDTINYDPGCCGGFPDDGWNQICSLCDTWGGPNAPAHSGTEMAGYDSWNIDFGGKAELYTPRLDFSPY